MAQKICVISFDHWDYDKHIVTALQKKGIESFHIKIGGFKHKNIWTRFTNAMGKTFLKTNLKAIKRQEYILETLKKRGKQDQILVINPEIIQKEYHLKIKQLTDKYIAYLYDSVDRNPIEHLLDGIFDEIFSFDKNDIAKFGFKETTNYNYIETIKNDRSKIKNDLLYIASFDKRLRKIVALKDTFKAMGLTFKLIVVGKKTTLFKLKNKFSQDIKDLTLRRKRIKQEDLKKLYAETRVVLDIVRENQTGLSFRFFEAMAFETKVITNNKNVLNYDFYNPNNIMVIQNKNQKFDEKFFKTEYEPLPADIYRKYTISEWVQRIFDLD